MDWHQIVQTHYQFAHALDTNDWELYRGCLDDPITTFYEGAGLPEVTVPADDWTAFVSSAVTPQTTVHYFTNFATVRSRPRADDGPERIEVRFNHQSCHRVDTHGAGDSTLIQYGTYQTTVTKVPDATGWLIRRIHHRVAWSVGNPALVDINNPKFRQSFDRVFATSDR